MDNKQGAPGRNRIIVGKKVQVMKGICDDKHAVKGSDANDCGFQDQ